MGNDKTIFVRIATGRINSIMVGNSKLSPVYYREVRDIEELKRVTGENQQIWHTVDAKNNKTYHSEKKFHIIAISNDVLEEKLKTKDPRINGYPIKMGIIQSAKDIAHIDYDEVNFDRDTDIAVMAKLESPKPNVSINSGKTVNHDVFETVSENGTGMDNAGKKRGRRAGS